MQDRYDVIVVGAGPAGIFASLKLSQDSGVRVLMIDRGMDLAKRTHSPDHLMSGWGGAGAFSDGKLNLSTSSGGWLKEYLGEERLAALVKEVDGVYVKYGAADTVYGGDEEAIGDLSRRAALAGLRLTPFRTRHIGSDECPKLLQRMRESLAGRVDVLMETEVVRILAEEGRVVGVETRGGLKIASRFVIVAPGRVGAAWLKEEAERLGLTMTTNPVDIGVRVEVPAAVMEGLVKVLYEPKFTFTSKAYDDRVRTFCVCPNGFVVPEYVDDVVTVNGHSYKGRKSRSTNFAILVSTRFTEPFKDPIAYGKYIAKLANLLVGGVMVQRLGDLDEGRRSTADRLAKSIVEPSLKDAKPGDLSFVLPARYLSNLKEMLMALDKVTPGVYSKHTLLYGVEVKFYSNRLKLTDRLETEISNLFAVGDGAGITRGLVQSSASGLIAAEEILNRARR